MTMMTTMMMGRVIASIQSYKRADHGGQQLKGAGFRGLRLSLFLTIKQCPCEGHRRKGDIFGFHEGTCCKCLILKTFIVFVSS